MRCHNCGSDKTESDASSGTSYCVDCGTVSNLFIYIYINVILTIFFFKKKKVLEENTIVAEVTFGETSGGKAVLQGSYAGESGKCP
jgi:transcription factor IIIB subunit 2